MCRYAQRRPVGNRGDRKGVKSTSIAYFLEVDNKQHRVCKKFFSSTLRLSNNAIATALKNENLNGTFGRAGDKRGSAPAINKTPDIDHKLVCDHISSYPAVEPHYVRKDSTKKYLDSSLDKAKMYRNYCTDSLSKGKTPVSKTTFLRILDKEFPDLGFHKPKKDQCATCTKFQNLDGEAKEAFRPDYEDHIRRKEEAKSEKVADKQEALSNPVGHRCITYDLQSVLYTPCSAVSTLYYKRKLAVYNFTIYEDAKKSGNGLCYLWEETDGNRGSVEIGSCLLKYLEALPITVKYVTMFSDTCGGQNRNQYVAAALLHCVKHLPIEVIEQKFLESGHTYMEVDSMHSAIESAKKGVSVYYPDEWFNIIAAARPSKPYEIRKMRFGDFYAIKPLAEMSKLGNRKDTNGESVNWIKIKILRYEKAHPAKIFFKYNYSDLEFKVIDLEHVCTRRRAPLQQQREYPEFRLKAAYSSKLPISVAKKKDLISLCESGAIPAQHHCFYQGLSCHESVRDALAEPDREEIDEDEVEY